MTTSTADNSAETQARRLETVAEQLTTLLRRPEVAQRLRSAPSENEWSAMQILAHMVEMIPYWLHHYQTLIAATGAPPHFGRSLDAPDRLAGAARGVTGNAEELFGQLTDEVRAAAQAIRQMLPAERAKNGIHDRLGLMTVADAIELFIVAHAEDHLAQVRATLST